MSYSDGGWRLDERRGAIERLRETRGRGDRKQPQTNHV